MKQYKVKKFTFEAKKHDVLDSLLCTTLNDFLNLNTEGQQRQSLGSGLYKLRLATQAGRGKRGGSRSIFAFKRDNRMIWLHIFAKNEKGNVTTSELKKLKALADILLKLSDDEISMLINSGELYEVINNV